MILKALYDYYHRCGDLPSFGMELKEIGFIIVLNKEGNFLRFEDRRIDKNLHNNSLSKKVWAVPAPLLQTTCMITVNMYLAIQIRATWKA